MNANDFTEQAEHQELPVEPPPVQPDMLWVPKTNYSEGDHSLDLAGSDLLLGC